MDASIGENIPRPTETEDNLYNLVDEKLSPTPDFKGATLELDSAARNGNDPEVKFAGMKGGSEDPGNFDRNRPGSVIGRQSVTSTGSKASMSSSKRWLSSSGDKSSLWVATVHT